ncbi:hypothetical protein YY92_08215 [Campylobacter fetus]|uniref:terminase gpA endonuclease subunit n=1 Tax=Campylobacter fetus TaxID=196 RepID=UPI0011CB5926|nr:terminase gpA endonuclease subunit [Campylobacter fetus]EAJ1232627.1 hypothetical protein [Campylobacter fetus]EAK0414694.1 hypothetical protein [Campylobacter fetus]TXF09190.1 hypothetical protein FPD25_03390 [Campylobacter fetus subsp. fetus]
MIVTPLMIEACKWKDKISADKWALENYILEKESAVGGGKYSFDKAPHAKLPLKIFSKPTTKTLTLMFASQASKTTIAMVLLNWFMDMHGGNIMFFLPQDALVKFAAIDRILPAIQRTINAKSISLEKEERKLKDNTKDIRYIGGTIRVLSSASAINRKSTPAKLIILDEVAEMKDEHVAEIEERGKTYELYGGKILKTSTIMNKNDAIDLSFKVSEAQYEYFCKCPYCNKEHIDDLLSYLIYPSIDEFKKTVETNSSEAEILLEYASYAGARAKYKCPHCGELWDNGDKNNAVINGGWKLIKGNDNSKSVGFRCSSFISLFITLETMAVKYLSCANEEQKTAFYRGWLSKIYKPELKSLEINEVKKTLDENISENILPDNTIALYGSIDVQKDHYYYSVVAFDDVLEPYVIDYGRINSTNDLYNFILMAKYDNKGLNSLIKYPECWGIDSGFDANSIYELCYELNHFFDNNKEAYKQDILKFRNGLGVQILPFKGSSKNYSGAMNVLFTTSRIEKDRTGKMLKDPLTLYILNTYHFKNQLFSFIDGAIKGDAKRLHIHNTARDDIFDSLISEAKTQVKLKNNALAYEYVPTKTHPFNHYLDTLGYSLALAEIFNIRYRPNMLTANSNIKNKQKKKTDYLDEF